MGGASVTRVYVHPVTDENGCFVYDETDETVYTKTGYAIYYADAQYISKVTATPSETVNNPVAVHLTNHSVWNVAGECYLQQLTIDESSTVNGKLLVNGKETEPVAGNYSGELFLTAI